jgi:hypothetical protein
MDALHTLVGRREWGGMERGGGSIDMCAERNCTTTGTSEHTNYTDPFVRDNFIYLDGENTLFFFKRQVYL